MNIYEAVIESIPAKDVRRNEGDFVVDGVLHCGNCKGAKQVEINGKLRSCQCACEQVKQAWIDSGQRERHIKEIRAACFPGEKQRKSRFETAEHTKLIIIAEKYVAHWEEFKADGTGLIFYGGVGTGKSFAAQCLANALMDKEIRVRYITAADALATLTDRHTDQEEFLNKMRSPELLIIDDLGAEHDSCFSQAQMCRIIDARRESGLPIVVTTNLTLQEMQKPSDQARQRIFDRLLGSCTPVLVEGKSRREAEGKSRLERARKLLTEE